MLPVVADAVLSGWRCRDEPDSEGDLETDGDGVRGVREDQLPVRKEREHRRGEHTAMIGWHWLPRGLVYAAFILLILILTPEDDVPFIYFQF